jgi:aminobenzoyl-glutamate utilization protein B
MSVSIFFANICRRVAGSITDAGGRAANVVQAKAEVLYLVRAQEMSQALALVERVDQVARGAAMMTGTEVDIIFDTAATNLLPNLTLENAIHHNLVAIGPVPFDAADIDFAQKIQATFTQEAIRSGLKLYQIRGMFSPTRRSTDRPLCIVVWRV